MGTAPFREHKTPFLTVDVLLERGGKILLIRRKNPPHGWALPGGFVDYGESVETAAVREAKEELNVDIELVRQFHVYSQPGRDPRQHTASVVFVGRLPAGAEPRAGDDAGACGFFAREALPEMAFDHRAILEDWFSKKY